MLMTRGLLALCGLFLIGCPVAPPEQPPQSQPGPLAGGAPGGPGEGAPDGGAPPEGGPPADGQAPPEGGPPPADGEGAPPGGEGTESLLDVQPGEGVAVSGTVSYDGSLKGDVRVDMIKENYQGSPMPRVMTSVLVGDDGAWEIEVPKGFGKVNVVAYLDSDGNGLSPGEPIAAKNGVNVKNAAVSGISLKLSDDPSDLEIHLPPLEGGGETGGAPPADGEAPPADGGAPPPDGGAPPADGGAPPADGAAPPTP